MNKNFYSVKTLQNLTLKQLKKLAKQSGKKVYPKDTKAALIKRIHPVKKVCSLAGQLTAKGSRPYAAVLGSKKCKS